MIGGKDTPKKGNYVHFFPLNIAFFIRPSTVCVNEGQLVEKRKGQNVLCSCCLINHCITSDMCRKK